MSLKVDIESIYSVTPFTSVVMNAVTYKLWLGGGITLFSFPHNCGSLVDVGIMVFIFLYCELTVAVIAKMYESVVLRFAQINIIQSFFYSLLLTDIMLPWQQKYLKLEFMFLTSRVAGSNLAEVDGFFQDVKILSASPSGRTLKHGSRVSNFRLVKEPQPWKNRPLSSS